MLSVGRPIIGIFLGEEPASPADGILGLGKPDMMNETMFSRLQTAFKHWAIRLWGNVVESFVLGGGRERKKGCLRKCQGLTTRIYMCGRQQSQ